MRTEWLKFFLEVSKTGSLRTAANNLYITQPALGTAIRSLEKELGYPLFIRSHSGMQLTSYAVATLPLIEAILSNLKACEEIKKTYLDTHLHDIAGTLNIATVPTIGTGILPQLILSFVQSHPKLKLVIMENNSDLVMRQILSGQSDLGFFVTFDENNVSDEYGIELLWQERLYAFMRKDNLLSTKTSISLKTLQKYPLAILSYEDKDFSVRDALFTELEDAPNIVFRSNNHNLLTNYVLSTDCIGLTHIAHVFDKNTNILLSPAVSLVPIKNCPISKFVAFYRKDSPKIESIRLFIQALLEFVYQ